MKPLNDITPADVLAAMAKKDYVLFSQVGVPNIVGIRSAEKDDSDYYNDKCFVWWKKENGQNEWHSYTITTHPGYYYLEHPIAGTKGTAILVPGQYLRCWELAMHKGKQFALCQHCGPVKVYRDDNKDTVLNYDPATIEEGFFGIDLHSASLEDSDLIGKYSAGCQVWRYHDAHSILMEKFKLLGEEYVFRKFSYSLLLQDDFT
jgi:hypothetical protein